MARRQLKISNPEIQSVLRAALEEGAMPISDACKAIRALNGLSQESFANLIGLSVKVIKEIESGKANPRLSSLQKLAGFAGLKVVFAAQPKVVRLSEPGARREEKRQSRNRDFSRAADGAVSREEISRSNALKIGRFDYKLPDVG
jgi:transcriptional regulator with XRE-family HTH domain